MRDVIDQIRRTLDARLYFPALFTTLTLPDIAAALDAPDGRSTERRYVDWYTRWCTPRDPVVDGVECYQFRCSLLHQGTTEPQNASRAVRHDRLLFIEPGATTNSIHGGGTRTPTEDVRFIDLNLFCEDILCSVEAWLPTVENTPLFKQNFDKFARRRPDGYPPHIVGVAVVT